MFLDAAGNADPKLSQYSGLAIGVPGTVAGLALALERYGTMTLQQVMAPAIRLAEEGIVVTPDLSDSLKASADEIKAWPSSTRIFFKEGGAPYEPGDLLQQPELARTLERIAAQGPDGFYKGETARLIAAEMKAGGSRVKAETRQAAADLKKQRDEVAARLDRATHESEEKWERFKTDVRDGVNRIEQGYNNLLEKMKTNN